MNVSLHDVHQALVQLGRLRFGEMNIEEAVREIVHTTHAIFSVDGAGLMLVRAGIAGDAADLRADGCGITVAPGIAAGAEPGLPQ